jgi:hypothetical protein
MKTVETFWAKIYVGLRVRYTGEVLDSSVPEKIIQDFTDAIGFCVTITPTRFIYKDGQEPGIIVGLINYPRFPLDTDSLKRRAIYIAQLLMQGCRQLKVSIVFKDKTIMLENTEEPINA